jgi:hypothetical protein
MGDFQFSKPNDAPLVSLTGGLGNQLFQIAHVITVSREQSLIFTQEFGRPRLNKSGDAEIFSFKIPIDCEKLSKAEAGWVTRKILGHLLKISENPKGLEAYSCYRKTFHSIVDMVVSLHYRKRFKVSTKVEENENPSSSGSQLLYVGYFQEMPISRVPRIREVFQGLEIEETKSDFINARRYLEAHDVTIIHIRLTDYLNEPGIGLLDPTYFVSALKKLSETSFVDEIWVFSDDMELARDILRLDNSKVHYVSQKDFSVAETFELMRLGSKYILSNSTFGWWAAFLCRKETPNVIMPMPWFRSLSYSETLHLQEWKNHEAVWAEPR